MPTPDFFLRFWGFSSDKNVCGPVTIELKGCPDHDPLAPWVEFSEDCSVQSLPSYIELIKEDEGSGKWVLFTDDENLVGNHSYSLVYTLKNYPQIYHNEEIFIEIYSRSVLADNRPPRITH